MGIYIEEFENMKKFIELQRKRRQLQERQIKEGLSQKSIKTSIVTKNIKSYGRSISIKKPKADIIIKYRLNRSKSFFQNFSDMMAYRFGFFDDLENMNSDELLSEEKNNYWEDVVEVEAIQKSDEAFSRKIGKFKLKIAAIGLAGCISVGVPLGILLGKHLAGSVNEENGILSSVKNIDYEVNKAQLYGNDYLDLRINPNFIPENATEEEMLEFRQKAWEALEPEIQKYVNSPQNLQQLEIERREEEARRIQFLKDEPEVREKYLEQIRRIEKITGHSYENNLLEKISKTDEKTTFNPAKELNEKIFGTDEENVENQDVPIEIRLERALEKFNSQLQSNKQNFKEDLSNSDSKKTVSNSDKKEIADRELGD